MNHIITHTHIHKYQFSNSTRKMLEDLSGGASMKRRGKRRRGEKEREEKKRGRKKNGRRKKKGMRKKIIYAPPGIEPRTLRIVGQSSNR